METVFTNADFISLDEHNNTYSVMVVKGKNIVYMGYSVPFAYDDAKVIDLGGKAVVPKKCALHTEIMQNAPSLQ